MSYDVNLIAAYVHDLGIAQKGLKWLEEYGPSIAKEEVQVSVKWYVAQKCEGAKEASAVIGARLENGIQDAILKAIEDRRNTIEILRSSILRMLGDAA